MGRLSRHRKIKSCDPFYKGPKETDVSFNTPVKQSEVDHQPVPRKAKALFKFRKKKHQNNKLGKNATDAKMLKADGKFLRKVGEGQREYFERLDKQTAEEVSAIISKERHVSQKRKQYLKARKERKIKKGFQEDCHMEFSTDHFKFGEVVNEPPKLTTKPRHADLKQDADKSKRRIDSLLLQSKLQTSKKGEEKEKKAQEPLVKYKKRKHMSAIEQQRSDKMRLDAIDAYRKLKKTTPVQQDITGIS